MNRFHRLVVGGSLVFMIAFCGIPLARGDGSVVVLNKKTEKRVDKNIVPLRQAHAHNDYEHKRPLFDALSHGFSSVESDIYLVRGKLLVAHNFADVRSERTLEALYLDPLRKLIKQNGGRVHRGGPQFTLMIDIKSEGKSTYLALSQVLANYADILSIVKDGKLEEKAVTVVISGNRPFETVAEQKIRYAGIDGRLGDLDSKMPAHLMPIISDRWSSHFRWRGVGKISKAERVKLRDAVKKSHAAGRKIRFWATPEKPAVWKELREAGVDMINTDDLAGLEKFLLNAKKQD